ncbi:MAG: TOPRIM nucleotidyl transferase/hydrolase domain-containing protein [Candidatus Gastranaerophilaceae bacterium]
MQKRIPFIFNMNFDLKCDKKYKLMTEEDILISLDRLSRFKNPEIKYVRVFYDIILKHLIFPSVSKHKLDELPSSFLVDTVTEIWNNSVENIFGKADEDCFSLKQYDEIQYNISDSYILELMNADLKITPILKNVEEKKLPKNVLFLKKLFLNYSSDVDIVQLGDSLRYKYKTLFPIKKLILTEGITEEILLPKFAEISGYNFDENGVYILATGGKSKVLSIYAELKYVLKIPVFVLLDNDAEPVYNDIVSVLRKEDKAYLIKSGEFEDILSKDLIIKSFSDMNYDVAPAEKSEISSENGTCFALENLWKSRGLGEFRKAHFAKAASKCLNDKIFISDEIKSILDLIINL